jgi:protein-tyrosine-phosphatase
MAEGFARAYGRDVAKPASAGLTPALNVDPTAVRMMGEIGISIADAFPKHYRTVADRLTFDLVINISGRPLPGGSAAPVREWEVSDPIGRSEEEYRRARDLIQRLTLTLLNELRAARPESARPESTRPEKLVPAASARMQPAPPPSDDGAGRILLDRRRRTRTPKPPAAT